MPLTNKYLKYSPEITLEIFTLIWNKLISNGYKPFNNFPIIRRFNEFAGNYPFFRTVDYHPTEFSSYATKDDYKEITVQEILGYDPFIKEDFVLPEKWYLKVTKENLHLAKEFCIGKDFNLGDWSSIWKDSDGTIRALDINNLEKDRIEISLAQFKKYVLKEPIETPKEEVIPEYVECIGRYGNAVKGIIYSTISDIDAKKMFTGFTWKDVLIDCKHLEDKFKPSTKEAFDAQNQPKIKLEDLRKKAIELSKNGFVDEIRGALEKFKTPSISALKESDYISFMEYLNSIDKPKQPLKQAVHCKTQEEWGFVQSKVNYKFINKFIKDKKDCINLETKNSCAGYDYYKSENYQILSFQEWCDLNGYKMEKEVKFEVGKWYRNSNNTYAKCKSSDSSSSFLYEEWINDGKFEYRKDKWYNHSHMTITSIEEIQQYLPENHPDKIKSNQDFKVGEFVVNLKSSISYKLNEICKISLINDSKIACEGKPQDRSDQKDFKYFRHATPEEINNHLISTGQIPDLGKQEPEKYPFKPLRPGDLEWEIQFPQIKTHSIMWSEPAPMTEDTWKSKITLSIDDELPKIKRIKIESI